MKILPFYFLNKCYFDDFFYVRFFCNKKVQPFLWNLPSFIYFCKIYVIFQFKLFIMDLSYFCLKKVPKRNRKITTLSLYHKFLCHKFLFGLVWTLSTKIFYPTAAGLHNLLCFLYSTDNIMYVLPNSKCIFSLNLSKIC